MGPLSNRKTSLQDWTTVPFPWAMTARANTALVHAGDGTEPEPPGLKALPAVQPSAQPPSSKPRVPVAITPASDSTESGQWPTKRGRVLLADDEPELRRSFTRLLRATGYDVIAAPDGDAAAKIIAGQELDAIVTDIAMPSISGIQLLQIAREHDLDVPVILVTGEPAVSTAVQALEYGAFHYLLKPVANEDLLEVVDKAVCLSRMARMKREAAEILGEEPGAGDRVGLETSFRRAMSTLWMAYQPILCAKTRAVFGYEALLRSNEPSLPHPGAVIEAAERLEALDLLGRTIRERAAGPIAPLESKELLFVNLHTTDLLDSDLLNPDAALSKIAHRVVLEITERSSLDCVKDVKSIVSTLREMGYRIAIDDLGAGYAGLTSFATLEPEIVKLDMTLVRDVDTSATKQKLVRSMTALCKDMGMLVVAEGIETGAERDTLAELGCDLFQGFKFAKPGKPFPTVQW